MTRKVVADVNQVMQNEHVQEAKRPMTQSQDMQAPFLAPWNHFAIA